MGGCADCKSGGGGCESHKGPQRVVIDEVMRAVYPDRTWGRPDDEARFRAGIREREAQRARRARSATAAKAPAYFRAGGPDDLCHYVWVLVPRARAGAASTCVTGIAPPEADHVRERYLRVHLSTVARIATIQEVALELDRTAEGWLLRELPQPGVYDAKLLKRMRAIVDLVEASDLEHLDFGLVDKGDPEASRRRVPGALRRRAGAGELPLLRPAGAHERHDPAAPERLIRFGSVDRFRSRRRRPSPRKAPRAGLACRLLLGAGGGEHHDARASSGVCAGASRRRGPRRPRSAATPAASRCASVRTRCDRPATPGPACARLGESLPRTGRGAPVSQPLPLGPHPGLPLLRAGLRARQPHPALRARALRAGRRRARRARRADARAPLPRRARRHARRARRSPRSPPAPSSWSAPRPRCRRRRPTTPTAASPTASRRADAASSTPPTPSTTPRVGLDGSCSSWRAAPTCSSTTRSTRPTSTRRSAAGATRRPRRARAWPRRPASAQLVLFHHDPTHDDWQVARIEAATRARFPATVAAREGLELTLDAGRRAQRRLRSTRGRPSATIAD